ncbi:MAG: hypothetical protein JWP17_689 [Solirubrobacterales bacterium]|jgi:ectoine hydroxylase-related dioxygenase (phytanoyl-CoA dioxygenase family)|nr:hypothetical protein [Solirubrobacterales bacterium]
MNESARTLDTTVLTHGIKRSAPLTTPIEQHIEELRIKGFTLVDSGLTAGEIADARTKLDDIYEVQADEVGGEANLKLMNDANIARAVCAYDPLFLKIATLPVIMQISAAYLEQYVVLMSQNGIINQPSTDHYQFTWHRDLNYQHFTSSRPLSLSALVALDPFDDVTGGTYVLPATHLVEDFPSDEYVVNNQQVVTCPAGTIIFFNSMLFHRTGRNSSAGVRRAVNHIIVPPMLRQQYDFKGIFEDQGVEVDDPAVREYLGFAYTLPKSIREWRAGKIDAALAEQGAVA